MRKLFVICWLGLLFAGVAFFFWHSEYVYSLPTPVPENYQSVVQGQKIDIRKKLGPEISTPVFLHFFNPACPCSKFNVPHFKSLVKQYGGKVFFAVVVMSTDSDYTVRDIQNKFGLDVPVLFDKSLAVSCGVYSTPQAVILDKDDRLYFRGNYNKSRYCTDKESNYAQLALDSLLGHTLHPVFSSYALTAYGCELPNCNKK